MSLRGEPHRARGPNGTPAASVLLVLAFVLSPAASFAIAGASASASALGQGSRGPAAGVDFLNLSTTENVAFAPDTLTVHPGDQVRLVITQLADFDHTFVLSPVPNVTLPASSTAGQVYAFFVAHPPLVNLSLGSTMGARSYANFTAPAAGSYEFVCEIPTHFQSGMHGELISTSSTGTSPAGIPLTVLLAGAAVGVVAVVGIVAAVLRRRRAAPPPQPSTAP